jgi:predicted metalloprotease
MSEATLQTFKGNAMRRFLTLLILLGLCGGEGFVPVAADEQHDIVDATARAKQIFRLADQERYNAMYDLIHPDAHAVVPRVVAVNTFQELYALAEAGRAEVVDVSIGSWTWGVTGQTYDYTAIVEFEQPFVENGEEKMLQDTMYLVQADPGDWRWFFGGTRNFVDLAIETFGEGTTVETGGTPLVEGDLINNTINDLDRFYREAFNYTDIEYVTPGAVLVESGDSEMTACGPAQTGFWAFYCPGDQTVYLDEAFLADLGQKAQFAEAFVIAHEWAHHIQTNVGLERVQEGDEPDEWNEVYSIELELMADCMSGAWAQDVDTRGLLRTGDIDDTIKFTIQYLGDPAYIDEYEPQAHGSAEQRATAFKNGYEEGYLACNIMI